MNMTEVQIVGTAMTEGWWVLHCSVCGPLGLYDYSAINEAENHLNNHAESVRA